MDMPIKAKAYWMLVVVTGVSFYLFTFHNFHHADLSRLLFYVFAAIMASGLKTRLPGIFVTLSVNYIIIMAAVLSLSLGESMIVGIASALGQCCIRTRQNPRWFQVVFSAAAMALPILAAESIWRSHLLSRVDTSGFVSLLAASIVYFFLNTFTVAGIISLTSGKRLLQHWCESYLRTSVHYLVGGGIAGAFHFLSALS